MRVDIYDTYASDKNGNRIHFDVLVKNGDSQENAYKYALLFLSSIDTKGDLSLHQSKCNFCHTEKADENTISEINKFGYSIIQMEGCPNGV